MSRAHGFDFESRANGDVVIRHHGRQVTVLRGIRAQAFLDEVTVDPQRTMARWTGNYKHGNERVAGRRHRRS